MIRVIATATLKPGSRAAFLDHFLANVPNVLAEEGCLLYEPCVDAPVELPMETPQRDDVVVIVEAWESEAHLKAHLAAPHMATYREQVKDLVEGVSLQVLRPVSEQPPG